MHQYQSELSNTSLSEEKSYWDKKYDIFEAEYYRFMDRYVNLQEMLESTNGVIYTAESLKDQGQVIMKKIWRDRVATFHEVPDGRECPNEIWYHMKALEASPKLVVPLLDWFEFEDFYLVVLPKIPKSCDLFQLLSQNGPLAESRAKKIFKQLVRVCHDLQKHGICHRDIKDENILVDKQDNIYLIDFGTTMDYDSSYSDQVGTECFFSPEYFDRGFFRPEELTVWSLGAVLYMLLVRCWRFKDQTWHRRHADESHLSKNAINLIDRVLNPVPEDRAKLVQIISSDWLNC